MLTKFIRFYDDAAQNLFGEFLEKNMQMFTEQQKQMMGGLMDNPVTRIVKETTERNLLFWQDMQQKFLDIATSGIRQPAPEAEDDEPKSKKKRK